MKHKHKKDKMYMVQNSIKIKFKCKFYKDKPLNVIDY